MLPGMSPILHPYYLMSATFPLILGKMEAFGGRITVLPPKTYNFPSMSSLYSSVEDSWPQRKCLKDS